MQRIDDGLQVARIVDAQAQIDGRTLDEVDFLPVAGENGENVGKPLFEHEREVARSHGNQYLVLFENPHRDADRPVRFGADDAARFRGVAERTHVERNACVLERFDGFRMDDLRTAVRQLDGVEIAHPRNEDRVVEQPGIGVEDAVHVLPDRDAFGAEHRADECGRVVRAFASQRRGIPLRRGADESLSDEQALRGVFHRLPQQGGRPGRIDLGLAVAVVGDEAAPHVDPSVGQTPLGKIFRHDGRREQFAVTDEAVVPAIVVVLREAAEQRADFVVQGPETGEQRRRIVEERAHDLVVLAFHFGEAVLRRFPVAPHPAVEHFFERIGGFAHRRYDDEKTALFPADDTAEIFDAFGRADRGASEFIDFERLHGQWMSRRTGGRVPSERTPQRARRASPRYLRTDRRSNPQGSGRRSYSVLYRTSVPVFQNMNESTSVVSSIRLEVGFPAPCPALVSMRMSVGRSHPCAA